MTNATKRILILGATSAIAEATARIWAAQGARFVLVARNEARLEVISSDLKARGADVVLSVVLDCAKAHARTELDKMAQSFGGFEIVLLAYGVLGDQKQLERDQGSMEDFINTNFTSAVAWSLAVSDLFQKQRSGTLVILGSVAGDRGRQSNFVYGATKGGLARVAEGIAHKLAPLGARALVVKPGFVDTPMTASFEKGRFLWAKPEAVAAIIANAAEKGGPVVYAPHFWRLIMLAIRHLPTIIFNKLKI